MYDMDEKERRFMGLKGRRYFEENFCREKMIDQLNNLMKNIKGKV